MNSRKNGTRLKKLKTMKKKGGMFDRQTFEFFKKSRPVSTKLKSTALSGQTKLILQRLGIPTGHNPQSSMQFATHSRINAKQRHTYVLDKLLEESKEFRERNDFENAALRLRQAIDLGSLPARAELADFFRTGRTMKDYRVWDDYYGAPQRYYDKAHALVYDQDDPDCKGVLALLYLDSAADATVFYKRPRHDPALNPSEPHWHSPSHYAFPLAQESADAGSKYGIYALGMWHLQDARKKADKARRMEEEEEEEEEADHDIRLSSPAPSRWSLWNLFPSRQSADAVGDEKKQKIDEKKQKIDEKRQKITQLKLEIKASECEGVKLIGIAASPPYNYDQAQFMYGRFYLSGFSNGFSCLMDMDKIKGSEGSEFEKEQQLHTLAMKYFKMAAAQGDAEARRYVEGNRW
jgi:hypothetical protein